MNPYEVLRNLISTQTAYKVHTVNDLLTTGIYIFHFDMDQREKLRNLETKKREELQRVKRFGKGGGKFIGGMFSE